MRTCDCQSFLSEDREPLSVSPLGSTAALLPVLEYLAEDFAFSERARQCGFKIYADTRIRLYHFGDYGFSWEDAGESTTRYESYRFRIS